MNPLPGAAADGRRRSSKDPCCEPFPNAVIYILLALFAASLAVSLFILATVHDASFLVSFLLLSSLVLGFVVWNARGLRGGGALRFFVSRLPDSDLRKAEEGQLVKVTGFVSCGNISLESSYEKVPRCVYTSTLLYKCRGFGSQFSLISSRLLKWGLVHSERISTDFWITDTKSGMRALVKAGDNPKVIPLVTESALVKASSKSAELSSYLRRWLGERNLLGEARLMRLEEGYIKEGNLITVVGVLHRNEGVAAIFQPPESFSTGCLWQRLFLPIDVDGLILRLVQKGNSELTSVTQVR